MAQVTLAWSSSGDPEVAGYRVYFGVSPGYYTNSIDVLDSTNCSLSNLVAGARYYFAARAYDFDGVESVFSTEVFTTIGTSNTPPFISSITNVAVAAGATTPAIPFTVSDAQTPASALTVSASSDNQNLVKNSAILLSGIGTNRSVTISADSRQTGSATITLTVSDGSALSSTAFQANVRSKPLPPGRIRPKG